MNLIYGSGWVRFGPQGTKLGQIGLALKVKFGWSHQQQASRTMYCVDGFELGEKSLRDLDFNAVSD